MRDSINLAKKHMVEPETSTCLLTMSYFDVNAAPLKTQKNILLLDREANKQ
jgi:hypothetical protein